MLHVYAYSRTALILLLTVPVFELLRRTNDEFDCIKTFDTFESQITVFGNMCQTKLVLMNNVYLESFKL